MAEESVIQRTNERRRATDFRRLAVFFAVAGLVTLGLYLAVYWRTQAWQTFVAGGAVVLGLVFALVAHRLVRRDSLNVAGYLILAALATFYLGGELSWSNMTPYLAAGGLLSLLVAGSVVLPRSWGSWIVTAGVYGLLLLLINRLEPIPRFDITQIPVSAFYIPGVGLLSFALIIWRVARAYRGIPALRTRLLIAFVVLVLVPTVAISFASALTSFRSGQAQVENQLKLVAEAKKITLDSWRNELESNLSAALQESYVLVYALRALETSPDEIGFFTRRPLEQALHEFNYRTGYFDELFLLDLDGRKIATSGVSDSYVLPEKYDVIVQEEQHGDRTYFERGLEGSYVTFYSTAEDGWGMLVLRPVLDAQENVKGVLVGYTGLDELNDIMRGETRLGETVKTYLVGPDHSMLTELELDEGEVSQARSQGIDTVLENRGEVDGMYEDYRGVRVVGVYRWLPELKAVLVAEQDQAEAFRPTYAILTTNVSVTLVSILLAVGASLLVARSIANPLSELTETATQIAGGDLERTVAVEREDEIGKLAQAFNSMTAQLRGLIDSLEQRVAERTRDLERRSDYLEASAEVAQAASSILDTEELIERSVELIRKRFGLYYVGLFLVDEAEEWAVLEAGTGTAGRAMLMQGHRLEIGGNSMIGQCVAQAEARIALDVGEEAVRFDNPFLPGTRSEAALPLRSRGRVLGAVTIQSDEEAAFDEDTITVLQTMADQLAVAIDNAQLLQRMEESLEASRRVHGELSREAWRELLEAQANLAYVGGEHGVASAEESWRPEMRQALEENRIVHDSDGSGGHRLAVPIAVRGEVIGVLGTYKSAEEGGWTSDEIAVLESLTERLSSALESARLYRETQRRAWQERLVADITAHVRSSSDTEAIMRTAVRELGAALGSDRVFIQLGKNKEGDGSTDGSNGE